LREDRTIQLRMDRIFEAGKIPGVDSGDHNTLWIADYKTSEPQSEALEVFLARERALYRPQLEGYAAAIRLRDGVERPIHLALYYPLLPAFDWWEYSPA
jgi:hypothetical protein